MWGFLLPYQNVRTWVGLNRMDLPRYCGGHRSPKKSGPPHGLVELSSNPQKFNDKNGTLRSTSPKYITVRLKPRTPRAVTISFDYTPCARRYLEHMGVKCLSFPYVEEFYPYRKPHKVAYEVRSGLLPLVSFSNVREAVLHCRALAHFGIVCHFVPVEVDTFQPVRGV